MRFIGIIVGLVGGLVLFVGIMLAVFGALVPGLLCASTGLALITFESVTKPPGWAFERAQQMSKSTWLLIAIIGVIPPLGIISFAMWVSRGKIVQRAARG